MYKREWNRTTIKHARKRHVVQTNKVRIGTRPPSCVCVVCGGGTLKNKYEGMHILHAQVSRSVWAKQTILDSLYNNGALSSR